MSLIQKYTSDSFAHSAFVGMSSSVKFLTESGIQNIGLQFPFSLGETETKSVAKNVDKTQVRKSILAFEYQQQKRKKSKVVCVNDTVKDLI